MWGMNITYFQGPLFFNELPEDFEVIATFSKIPNRSFNGVNKSKYIGAPAIICKKSKNQGSILLFSPHFEFGNGNYNSAHEQFLSILIKCFY
jgi:glutamine amidotransferase-like uncharacterized protein